MKDSIKLVILPIYNEMDSLINPLFFNLNNTVLDLSWLDESLIKLDHKYKFIDISIEGYDIFQLSDIYFDILFKLLKTYSKKIIVNTDFSQYKRALINGADVINVNFNFNLETEESKIVENNIKAASSTGKIININSLDISVNDNKLDIISNLNKMKIKAWKILPYYQTKYSILENHTLENYETTLQEYLKLSNLMQFSFINKLELDNVIPNKNFPIKTVYITPNNKFGLGKFDDKNRFFIEEYEDIESLEKNLEKQQNEQILICKDCKYKINCLADRYFNPANKTKHCDGLKSLIISNKGK